MKGILLLVLALVLAVSHEATGAQEGKRLDRANLESSLERVASSQEFRHLVQAPKKEGETLLDRLRRWLANLYNGSGKGETTAGGSATVFRIVIYSIAGVCLLLVIALVIRSLIDRTPRRAPGETGNIGDADAVLNPAAPPGEQPAEEYMKRAIALARRSAYKEAIAQLLLGSMSWIEREGLIRFRKGLSNRDYLRVARRRPDFRIAMAVIVVNFEEIHFGRRSATESRFQECLGQFWTGIHGAETGQPLA